MSEHEREEDKDLAQKPKKSPLETPNLVCPILSLRESVGSDYKLCLGSRCALWVKGSKDTIHPDYYLVYHGCGLISNVFWERQKRPLSNIKR